MRPRRKQSRNRPAQRHRLFLATNRINNIDSSYALYVTYKHVRTVQSRVASCRSGRSSERVPERVVEWENLVYSSSTVEEGQGQGLGWDR